MNNVQLQHIKKLVKYLESIHETPKMGRYGRAIYLELHEQSVWLLGQAALRKKLLELDYVDGKINVYKLTEQGHAFLIEYNSLPN